MTNVKGQVAVFVILALLIVAGIVVYGVVRGQFSTGTIPSSLAPVYEYYDQCIMQETRKALDIAGSQGGRVDSGTYIPGSDFMPFSSHLNFLGFPVPYWYYVSGNGVIKEHVPSKQEIEHQLAAHLREKIAGCDFSAFIDRGFSVNHEVSNVQVTIAQEIVTVKVVGNLAVEEGETRAQVSSRSLDVVSQFGKLYATALDVYAKEQREAFLENYTLDVLRLYAPVDGVAIQCSPKLWKEQEVVQDVQQALEANVRALRFSGSANTPGEKYFTIPYQSEASVHALYSKTWPWKIEIQGADTGLLLAQPVGTQQGLSVMGFCYVPYHFVYDLAFPVMFQISSGQEVFQFPVAVIIDKNMARKAAFAETPEESDDVDICSVKTQDVSISVFSTDLQPVDASLSYRCLTQQCFLGKAENGSWSGTLPACVNGFLLANAEGYAAKQQLFSSNSESSAQVLVDKEYSLNISVEMEGKPVSQALVTFTGQRTATASLPDVSQVTLSEGSYNVSVYVYGNSSLTIPASSKQECRNTPQSGFLGFFGGTKEECFTITLPETKLDYALLGGGTVETYLVPEHLTKGKLRISATKLPAPTSLEQVQQNYASFSVLQAEVQNE